MLSIDQALTMAIGDARKTLSGFAGAPNRKRVRIALLVSLVVIQASSVSIAELQLGRSIVDVTPRKLPALRNGGFIEATVDRVSDPLHARCLVLDDGTTRIALVVVDSCMIPRELCDEAKASASQSTGIPTDRILISATHTHSAPSVMDFTLGCRADPHYTKQLPVQIAESIVRATQKMQEVEVGFTKVDAGALTKNRRWITRPDARQLDPFGEPTVHAMMHPGHENLKFTGPSGPVDPWLSLLSFRSRDGKPLAVLANFSMHYFGGHPGVSSDYFGLFCRRLSGRLASDDAKHLCIMSQGTSGDLWWGDYARPRQQRSISDFTDQLVFLAVEAMQSTNYQSDCELGMVEKRMDFDRRTPDRNRLAWARRKLKLMGDRRPQDRPEVYAEQAVYLDRHPREQVVLQAIQIGPVGITAIPNEVYAITGLKLKSQSPLESTFNIELANGAAGYIPPPEQHALGGYTTWPARTAGLSVDAEPKIVETLLEMLEEVSGSERRAAREPTTAHSKRIADLNPQLYLRLGEMNGSAARDSSVATRDAKYVGDVAFSLPGIDMHQPDVSASRAVHLAGGHIEPQQLAFDTNGSISLWCQVAVPTDWRETTGVLVDLGEYDLTLTGTGDDAPGRLKFDSTIGETELTPRRWYHVVLVKRQDRFACYLNGNLEFQSEVRAEDSLGPVLLGGSDRPHCSWEGKLDEVAFFDDALTAEQVSDLYHSASERLAANTTTDTQIVERGPMPETAPLSADESLRRTMIREGYRIELVAAEPLVADPVAIDWDVSGRLWVVEMADYPYGIDGQGGAGGRVRILEDTDADGKYDRSTLFIDGLSFPTAVMPWRDGVLITAAPELIFAKDIDNDGRADIRRVVFSGFMEGNQQLRVNGLRWGLDNWVYCANGGHHAGFGASNSIRNVQTGHTIALGSRDFRFRPQTGKVSPLSGPSQFGRVRDDWGHWFGVQNSHPLWHYVLPDHYLRRNPDVAYPDARRQLRTPANPPVFSAKPPQKRFHSFENSGHYTSACGPCIYRDSLLFSRDETTHAFTCEPFHNLVQHHTLKADGVSFRGQRAPSTQPHDFFASADRWCRPVMSRTGPDGALWIVDMYRYMIEHPDWLPESGRDELRPYFRAGESKGRIYRVVRTGTPSPEMPSRMGTSTPQLVAQLESSNGPVRDRAQAVLVSEQRREAVPSLRQLLRESSESRTRLHALATLDGLSSASSSDLQIALKDASPAVRCHALRCLESEPRGDDVVAAASVLHMDSDDKVRLQLAFTLGQLEGSSANDALVAMMQDATDTFMISALISSAPSHYDSFIDLVVADPSIDLRFRDAAVRMSIQRPDVLRRLADSTLPKVNQIPSAHQLRLTQRWLTILAEQGISIDQFKATVDSKVTADRLDALLRSAWTFAIDRERDVDERIQAIGLVSYDARPATEVEARVADLLRPDQPLVIQKAMIDSFARNADRELAERLLRAWPTLSPDVRRILVNELMSNAIGRQAVLAEIEQQRIRPLELDAVQRAQLIRHHDSQTAERAARLMSRLTSSNRQQVIERFQGALELAGRPDEGRQVFDRVCKNCHGGDDETRLGPHLRSLTDRSSRSLLTAILDPNAAVEPRYVGYNVELKSGRTLHGVIVGETGGSLELRLLDGTRTPIVRSSIEVLQGTGQSFMPNGLEAELTPQTLADVMAYVQSL